MAVAGLAGQPQPWGGAGGGWSVRSVHPATAPGAACVCRSSSAGFASRQVTGGRGRATARRRRRRKLARRPPGSGSWRVALDLAGWGAGGREPVWSAGSLTLGIMAQTREQQLRELVGRPLKPGIDDLNFLKMPLATREMDGAQGDWQDHIADVASDPQVRQELDARPQALPREVASKSSFNTAAGQADALKFASTSLATSGAAAPTRASPAQSAPTQPLTRDVGRGVRPAAERRGGRHGDAPAARLEGPRHSDRRAPAASDAAAAQSRGGRGGQARRQRLAHPSASRTAPRHLSSTARALSWTWRCQPRPTWRICGRPPPARRRGALATTAAGPHALTSRMSRAWLW